MAMDENFIHQFDQAIAQMIEEGYVILVGPEEIELTAKGCIDALADYLTGMLKKAIQEKRDFLVEEREEIIAHLLRTTTALLSKRGGTHDNAEKRA